jgi:hypothetical protein
MFGTFAILFSRKKRLGSKHCRVLKANYNLNYLFKTKFTDKVSYFI